MTRACVTHIDETLEKLGVKSTMHINNPIICKLKKDDMALMFRDTLSLLDGLPCIVSDITSLQSELLVCKEEKLDSVKSVVQTSVCEIMKEEIKSCSSVVQNGTGNSAKPLCQSVLKKVVQDVVKTEDRSKKVMIFGLSEEPNKDVSAKVSEMFEAMGEKPGTDE